jgi:ABC-type phosphate transport system substrate-binding protein
MKRFGYLCIFAIFLFVSCVPSTPVITPMLFTVQYSFATTPWLEQLSICAGNRLVNAELRAADFQDLASSDLAIRIGQPAKLGTPAYQIGKDDLLVITNPHNPVHQLTLEQVRLLFLGRFQTWKAINSNDVPVHVWVFPAGEDVQQVFEDSALGGSTVTSQARLANSPEEMSQAIAGDTDAIGIITRRLKTENTSDVFIVTSNLPVLALTRSEPQGDLAQILACLQK